MKLVVALLAAVLVAGCGGSGAEPGASGEATVVLDFSPNAVHSGIYVALERGWFADEGVELEVRPPGNTTDAPKLLEAGRTDFAVMDINDIGTARERGFEVVAIGALVQIPLAAVIAADSSVITRPKDLEGREVGVTGLPSDDAVVDAIVEADGGDPSLIERTVIGFDSVAALSGAELDAATAFWNAEGVQLRSLDVPTREFRVGDVTDEPFPELVLVTTQDTVDTRPDLVEGMVAGFHRGSEAAANDPDSALKSLFAEVDGLDQELQRAQMDALSEADAFADGTKPGTIDRERVLEWARFADRYGIATPGTRAELLAAFGLAG